MKAFFDTNVYLAGLISSGLCTNLINNLAHHGALEVVTSQRVLAELERHLLGKFKWSAVDTASALDLIKSGYGYVPASESPIGSPKPCPDPDDAWILADALAADCTHFVTGDKALLNMKSLAKPDRSHMDIVSPRQMTLYLATGFFLDIPTPL